MSKASELAQHKSYVKTQAAEMRVKALAWASNKTAAELLRGVVEQRRAIDAIDNEAATKKLVHVAWRDALEDTLKMLMAQEGTKSLTMDGVGSARLTEFRKFSVDDPSAFFDFVVEQKSLAMFSTALKSSEVAAYESVSGKLPEGVGVFTKPSIRITKA